MFLINRKFVDRKLLEAKILTIRSFIKIKRIENKLHDNSQYCEMKFYILEKFKNEFAIINIKIEIYFVNDFKINVFIKTNILIFENMIFDFAKKKLIIIICENMIISIKIDKKKKIVNRIVKIFEKIVMIFKKSKVILIKIKKIKLSKNRDFNFFFILNDNLDSKEDFFAHVMKSNIKIIQIRNTSKKSYVLSKNFKIEHIKNYDEKNCYLISSKDKHLAIMLKKTNVFRKIQEKIAEKTSKRKSNNEIII